MKRISIIFFTSIFFIISSCSRVERAAIWADVYINSRIDQYFDANSMQSEFVKSSVKENLNKIRKQMLPILALELDKIQTIIKNKKPISVATVFEEQLKLKKIFYASLKIFEPNAQSFVRKLEPHQVESFKKEFNKKLNELQGDLDRPSEYKKKRFDLIKVQFESWIGPLSDDQRLAIQKFVNDNPFPVKEQIQNGQKLSKEFLDSLTQKSKRNLFIYKLFSDYESMRDPAYAQAIEEEQQKYFELIAQILNKLTLSQRQFLIEIINDRSEQLKKAAENKNGWLG